jgi:hypothetical protein
LCDCFWAELANQNCRIVLAFQHHRDGIHYRRIRVTRSCRQSIRGSAARKNPLASDRRRKRDTLGL